MKPPPRRELGIAKLSNALRAERAFRGPYLEGSRGSDGRGRRSMTSQPGTKNSVIDGGTAFTT
jgi:hypothetical protein